MGVGAVLALRCRLWLYLDGFRRNQFEGFFLKTGEIMRKSIRYMMLLCEVQSYAKCFFIRKDIAKIWRLLF